ncbi:class I SAM-dependent methyltransferase [Raineyella sp.]|uniref:Trans-aconitate 2-methyltransferase n=1 Tax=bioreactor metagenome TaxID=1076179 RepID=A0A644Z6J2_9ZZZZ|nr:class I SAM-dependent methyltransferase [Raineyella sp.]MEA5153368.1 class I SAM-dependent methyltransferase [Raineyella sp.]
MSSNEPTDRTSPVTHRLRPAAESFGVDAERYDRTRPPYPDSLVASIVAACPGREVLDVGCGTGILSRQFQAAGCIVLGVEPDPRMAQFARNRGLAVEQARFEDWDPAGRRFDAVVAGTAWHWVDPDAGATKAAQVLRPYGVLALFGHTFELPRVVYDAFTSAYKRAVPDAPFTLPAPGRAVAVYEAGYARAALGAAQSLFPNVGGTSLRRPPTHDRPCTGSCPFLPEAR